MDWIALLGNFGFPVVVALWFMFRMETVIKGNTDAINKMSEVIVQCRKR